MSSPTPAHADERSWWRSWPLQVTAYLVLFAVAIFLSYRSDHKVSTLAQQFSDAHKAGVVNGQQAVDGQNLAEQVQAQCRQGGTVAKKLGHLCASAGAVAAASPTPVPGPNGTVIPGPRGRAGAIGSPGVIGPGGLAGIPGLPGKPGASGAVGQRGISGPIGIAGPSGAAGASGAPGAPGVAGSPGAAGPSGPAGPSGASGSAGADGQPPLSFSFTFLTTTYKCDRRQPFDPASPQYDCVAS